MHHEMEKQLVTRDLELHEKEEELFLQLEKVIRLEEDCEKLRTEKDKMVKWMDRLEREKNEAYRQLRLQAESSEITRRNLERARLDAYRQFSVIAAEKDTLEKEVSPPTIQLTSARGNLNMFGLKKKYEDKYLIKLFSLYYRILD